MGSQGTEKKAFDELKALLLQSENHRLNTLENRLDNPMTRAKEISRSLPDAISMSVMAGSQLPRVIQPVIDDSLKESVRKDPQALADAIFPALGPGIRKAISSTLMGMIQSLNQMLNHSFSIQGLKWRFEAFKTGRPFAEVVMLHTLVFRVEQIFLVHDRTGILLDHVMADGVVAQDPDLVSGMLTAIQDFVRDSFSGSPGDDIETLRIGADQSVWVEKGDQAFIAAVIRGTPPVELRTLYREIVEEIHLKAGEALRSFGGDTGPFALFRETLRDGLQYREKKEKKQINPLVWLVLACFIAAGLALPGFWGYRLFEARQDWERRLEKLRAQKGVVVVSARKAGDLYHISGLKDPLVADPMLPLTPDEQQDIQARWQPFYSLDPGFVFQRAQKILAPPPDITLTFDRNMIIARGKATQAWIERFQHRAAAIPGVDGYDVSGIVNLDALALDRAMKRLEVLKIYFEHNRVELVAGQDDALAAGLETIREIEQGMDRVGTPVRVTIRGHTDSSGAEPYNLKLSRARAEKIHGMFVEKGVSPGLMSVAGVGTRVRLKEESGQEDRRFNRAVTFKTAYVSSTHGDRDE